ncbi:MAG: hypothetical protein JWM82_3303 [Myxococcales bacterium]|nr:hypothetical protein [Myxococcales bacterium]
MTMRDLDRKEFLNLVLGMTGLGLGLTTLASCGGGSSPSGGAGMSGGAAGTNGGGTNACETHAPTDTIGANHGHTLTVSQADVAAGVLKMYSIMGTATHDHTVSITSTSFDTLKTGQTITLTSTTNNNHSHTITVVCA